MKARSELRWFDFVIRLALLGSITYTCHGIAEPFFGPALWGIVLAVALRPAHVSLSKHLGGRERIAATLFGLFLAALIVAPVLLLAESLVSGVRMLNEGVKDGTLTIPGPPESVEHWPLVGRRLTRVWSMASTNFSTFIEAESVHLRDIAQRVLRLMSSTASAAGQFLLSSIIAAILLARYEDFVAGVNRLSTRLAGDRGEALVDLATHTIRNVALGVMGVALLQAALTGVSLSLACVPAAGLLSLVTLVLCVVQIGPGLVLLGTNIWLFSAGVSTKAVLFLIASVFIATIDNVLKPLIFGRGAKVPLVVVFIGALGGFLQKGVLGLFTGAVLLVLGYELFLSWLHSPLGRTSEGTALPLDEVPLPPSP